MRFPYTKRPALTKEQILFVIHKFRKCDITTKEGKKRLIDSFVNSIYLFDDYALVTCNFKEGTTKIMFDDTLGVKLLVNGGNTI